MSENIFPDNHQENISLDTVKRRSIKGVVALISRTLFLQVLTFAATFLLTIFLSPQEFGTFFVVTAVVNFLIYFSDIGLAAALIQKKEQIEDDDLATTFTIQQILVITLVISSLGFSNWVAGFYRLNTTGLALFRALVFAFFLSSLKTIPSVILERKLEFNKLIIPQIVENIIFYSVAVYFSWKGAGITSLTMAVILRGISGVVVIYALQPWLPKITLRKKTAKSLLSFGVPFQANSILALVKDDLLTAYLGKVLTLSQIGYIGWAQRWALMPLRFFSDSIIKVTFPAYSRLQHDKQELKKAVEKSLFAISLVVFPSVIGIVSIAPALVNMIPRYEQWQPALLSLVLFAINALWASISTTITNTLNAIGQIKKSLSLMIIWTVLTWVLTPILIKVVNYNGVALASALVACSSVLAIYMVKKVIDIKVLSNISAPLISTFIMGIFVYSLIPLISTSYLRLLLLIFGAAILYLLLMLIFSGKRLFAELAIIRRYLINQ